MSRWSIVIPALTFVLGLGLSYPIWNKASQEAAARLVVRVTPGVVAITAKSLSSPPGTDPEQPARNEAGTGTPESAPAMESKDSFGSGFIIDADGYILTNRHVVDQAYEISVTLSDGRRFLASLVGAGHMVDLALLKITGSTPFPFLTFGESDRLHVGDRVIAIGNPFGLGISVTSGIVSALNRDLRLSIFDSFIQTDAAINKGNSGGPLFNEDGEVVGINTAYYAGANSKGGFIGIGYSISADVAKGLSDLLRRYGYPKIGWIGVGSQTVSTEMAEAFGFSGQSGAILARIDPGSPAQGILEIGDVITQVDGRPIPDSRALAREIAGLLNTEIELRVWRAGQYLVLRVTPAEFPGEKADAAVHAMQPSRTMYTWTMDAGLDVSSITPENRSQFKLDPNQQGVVVTAVKHASPAAAVGFSAGDVLLTLLRQPITTPDQLRKALSKAQGTNHRYVSALVKRAETVEWKTLPVRPDVPLAP